MGGGEGSVLSLKDKAVGLTLAAHWCPARIPPRSKSKPHGKWKKGEKMGRREREGSKMGEKDKGPETRGLEGGGRPEGTGQPC